MQNPFLAIVQAQLEAVHQSLRLAHSVRDVIVRNQRQMIWSLCPVPVRIASRNAVEKSPVKRREFGR
jgi:hypothetical protein